MSDWMTPLGTLGVGITAILVAGAAWLPKILNGLKLDGLNGDVLDRLSKMEAHNAVQDTKSIMQDVKIHRFAVKVTKLVVVVIRLEGLLSAHNIPIPQDLIDDIVDLTKDDIEETP